MSLGTIIHGGMLFTNHCRLYVINKDILIVYLRLPTLKLTNFF